MKKRGGISSFIWFLAFCLFQLSANASPIRIGTTDELIFRLRQSVQNQYAVPAQSVLVLWNDSLLEEKLAKLGKNLSLEIEERDLTNLIGKTAITLRVMEGNRYRAAMSVSVKVDGWAEVFTARKAIQRGEFLSSDSVQLTRKKLSETPNGSLRVLAHPEDFKATRDFVSGAILTRTALEQQALVYKGKQVRVVVINDTLRLLAQGEAQENGVRDQMISVKILNFGSNEIVQGRVSDRGEITLDIK
ncbi:MAG: flagellar basal body P-ring formation protein FlgA [Candidatus Sericytochromatia bacterium]|nr:flagellar basal body P-ring formation protein FlgA [Candidatus Sericytochromatia bacterium]